MTKVMTIVGTRPEIIRLSRVIARLDQTTDHILVHTGQNYDYTLNQIFFEDLCLRRPDYYLDVETSSLGRVLGDTLSKTEALLQSEKPDAVLILGDTNSSIAAVMAKRLRIPVYHMEAGNRCFDENVPEETNRRLIDHVADFNLVYTEHARRNLLAEGLHPRRIVFTGSPMLEVLQHYRPMIEASDVLKRLSLDMNRYFLVSVHREENVDPPVRLHMLLKCLSAVQEKWSLPVIISTHPRTKRRLSELGDILRNENVRWLDPFGFHDYNKLQVSAACTLSDSGTISEECAVLGFAAVTLRDSIERPEALESGTIIMTGLEPNNVLDGVCLAMQARMCNPAVPSAYDVADVSERVVRLIVSTVHQHHRWAGLKQA